MENIISLRNIVVEFDGEKILKNIGQHRTINASLP